MFQAGGEGLVGGLRSACVCVCGCVCAYDGMDRDGRGRKAYMRVYAHKEQRSKRREGAPPVVPLVLCPRLQQQPHHAVVPAVAGLGCVCVCIGYV